VVTPQPGQGRYRAQIVRELQTLEEDLLWTEKAHFATATHYGRLHLLLGLTATIAATVAAATVVAQTTPAVPGIAALVAALASGLVTFLEPQETERRHLDAGRRLGALRVRTRQAIALDLDPDQGIPLDAWRELAASIARDKATADAENPGTSNRAFAAARRKIDAGNFDYAHTGAADQTEAAG
jgi:hypothetical protein